MEPLFKLALVRPAIAQDPETPSISLAQDSPFQDAMEQATASGEPSRNTLRRIARAYVDSELFIGEPSANPLYVEGTALAKRLDHLQRQATVSQAELVDAVKDAFGEKPEDLVEDARFLEPLSRLRDSLIAIKYLQEEHVRPIEGLTNQVRDMEVVRRVAEASFDGTGAKLRRYRKRSLQTPDWGRLESVLSTVKEEEERRKQRDEAEAERRKRAESLFTTYQRVKKAREQLTATTTDQLYSTQQSRHEGVTPALEFSRTNVLTQRNAYVQKLSDLSVSQLQAALTRGTQVDPLRIQDVAGATSAAMLADKVLANAPMMTGSPAFHPLGSSETGFKLSGAAAERLSGETKEVLKQRGLDATAHPLDRIVGLLQEELDTTGKELEAIFAVPARRSFKKLGNTAISVVTPVASPWTNISVGSGIHSPLPWPPLPGSIPATKGRVTPAGVADLLIVKQQLIGYERADVAHIENVLRGEKKLREHIRRQETEEIIFTETETSKTEERELETTDRFEMTREVSATIREEAAFKAGLTVSGSYGPTVEFSASAEGSISRSKEEATKSASTFSQEVTERSATKITERVLQRASLRTTTEVIEKNVHELNNIEGDGHIAGVYQWVNKLYQAQMFNYGVRMIFDFMVPEPAAFLVEVLKANHASATELQKPIEFLLRPQDVNEDNVGFWIRAYGATDVAPPPEMYKTKSADFKAGGGDAATHYYHSGQITIDEGYVAIQGSVGRMVNTWSDDYLVDFVLGRRTHRFKGADPWVWVTSLDSEQDSIPFALDTFDCSHVAVAIEVKCQRTARAMDKWRHETHAKLTTAYKARLAEYEEKLAALEAQAGVTIQGRNPLDNLAVMNDELKKHCISILTDQHYDLFDAIDIAGSNGLPQIDVAEAAAEGPYVRFFEQAFEWEHITWLTYPYFWGRKPQWDERLAFDDPDPLFKQFVRAGYARVSVPARPGFEGAIDHFMTYGELWGGGGLPPISSPLYLPIADEIAERLDRPGDEVPQGDPWVVRIPTTLVQLRADDVLPQWVQDEEGNWVPA